MKFIKSHETRIPLIILLVLVASAFVPIIPLLLIYLNSIILIGLEMVFNSLSLTYINIFGVIIWMLAYFISKKIIFKIAYVCLYISFLISYFGYATEDWDVSSYPYFLPFLIQAFIAVIPLYLVGFIKERGLIKS